MLLNNEFEDKKDIKKIVVTGGPCAGKTTALTWITNTFTKLGYAVIIIPETATSLITNGVAPWTCENPFEYKSEEVDIIFLQEGMRIHRTIEFNYLGVHQSYSYIFYDSIVNVLVVIDDES